MAVEEFSNLLKEEYKNKLMNMNTAKGLGEKKLINFHPDKIGLEQIFNKAY